MERYSDLHVCVRNDNCLIYCVVNSAEFIIYLQMFKSGHIGVCFFKNTYRFDSLYWNEEQIVGLIGGAVRQLTFQSLIV